MESPCNRLVSWNRCTSTRSSRTDRRPASRFCQMQASQGSLVTDKSGSPSVEPKARQSRRGHANQPPSFQGCQIGLDCWMVVLSGTHHPVGSQSPPSCGLSAVWGSGFSSLRESAAFSAARVTLSCRSASGQAGNDRPQTGAPQSWQCSQKRSAANTTPVTTINRRLNCSVMPRAPACSLPPPRARSRHRHARSSRPRPSWPPAMSNPSGKYAASISVRPSPNIKPSL